MCLIGLAVAPPGPWLLVVAANRDEFHDRHAAPAGYWEAKGEANGEGNGERKPPGVLAGRDLQGGGTWLGLRRGAGDSCLRIGALTNLRPGLMPAPVLPQATYAGVPPSRGHLVADFLRADAAPEKYLRHLHPPAAAYAGFNLLAIQLRIPQAGRTPHGEAPTPSPQGDPEVEAWYLNNLPDAEPTRVSPGIHTLSNATLGVPWPKTLRLQQSLRDLVDDAASTGRHFNQPTPDHDPAYLGAALLGALSDRTMAAPADLPRTGLEPARERLLSAPFIVDEHYGTRCSTVIVVSRNAEVFFAERRFGPGGVPLGTFTERFVLGS